MAPPCVPAPAPPSARALRVGSSLRSAVIRPPPGPSRLARSAGAGSAWAELLAPVVSDEVKAPGGLHSAALQESGRGREGSDFPKTPTLPHPRGGAPC